MERKILQALQEAVAPAIAASIAPTLPVKYLGRTFEIPDDGKWLEVIYIPNNVTDEFWDSGKTYQGLFRLILHWPLDDQGAYPPANTIMSISSGFAKGSQFTVEDATVTINDNPNLTGMIEEPPEMMFPMSIRYGCFKA